MGFRNWVVASTASVLALPVCYAGTLLTDDFEDGDLNSGVSWESIRPGASVDQRKDGGKYLLMKDDALILSPQPIGAQEYTISFNGGVTWSAGCRFIFLYLDDDNYYSFGLGNQRRGVFRKHDGKEEKLDDDALSKLTLPHKAGANADYKVYVRNDGKVLTIQIDRAGDAVDYDVAFTEENPAIVTKFKHGRFGFSGGKKGQQGRVDNVKVVDSRVVDQVHKAVTYYIDAKKGDDSRTAEQAQQKSSPWKTIQKAAEAALAGDTVLVAPGVYRETVKPVSRGGIGKPITFKALDPKNRPVISGAQYINQKKWDQVEITDFRGQKRKVYCAELNWMPKMVYQGDKRMMVSQEPNQVNAIDPYELKYFMKVPKQSSRDTLSDPGFLTQTEKDYWKGASLLLWDSYPNAIGEFEIIGSDPTSKSIRVKDLGGEKIGNKPKERQDLYALRGHLGLLDAPGEYYIDTQSEPKKIYLIPYEGLKPEIITAAANPNGFSFSGKSVEYITVDGFEIRSCAKDGIAIYGRGVNHITIRNCKSVFNMAGGIGGRFVHNITIENCLLRDNRDNGISFGNCHDMKVFDCEITENGDNGVWFGGGQPGHFNSERILLKRCYLHHARARRRHPDNYQMHQVKDITLDSCVFLQEGDQNMWCQYTDNFTIRNSIFINGALGINSSIHCNILNNVFWGSLLRFDRHLTNHPQNKDFYLPQQVVIRNNVLVNTSISFPPQNLVNRHGAFKVDHNFFSIANAHARSCWDWKGQMLALKKDSLVLAQQKMKVGDELQLSASTIWGFPAKLVLMYVDKDNYYELGLGNESGFFRIMNGQRTCIYKDAGKPQLRLPHKGGSGGRYSITSNVRDGKLVFTITRDSEKPVEIVDPDPSAASRFGSGTFGMASSAKKDYWCSLDDVQLTTNGKVVKDDFEDGDIAKGKAGELTWQIVSGGVTLKARGGTGVGFGEGSIVVDKDTDLSKLFRKLPDKEGEGSDFRLVPGSVLIDAGVDVGIKETLDGKARPKGAGVDIGPYEAD